MISNKVFYMAYNELNRAIKTLSKIANRKASNTKKAEYKVYWKAHGHLLSAMAREMGTIEVE